MTKDESVQFIEEEYTNILSAGELSNLITSVQSKNEDRVFTKNDIIIFGSETTGISENILNEYSENACTIPMINKNIRSLNLATSVGIVLYEAIRQINEK